jgi:predicted ATP-dependent Lon-type protease
MCRAELLRASEGTGVLLALCSALLQKSIKGGLVVTGGLNLGGSIEMIFNPVAVVENATAAMRPRRSQPGAISRDSFAA